VTLDWTIPFVLSTPWAIRALELLFALSAGIQTLEYWRMQARHARQGTLGLVNSTSRHSKRLGCAVCSYTSCSHLPSFSTLLLLTRLMALVSVATAI
jgi:hypothetical protein